MTVAASARDRREPLPRLALLERRYDGPPPPSERAIALAGSAQRHGRLQAASETAFFRTMIAGQIRTIRQRRADGSFYPALLSDLALYRRQWRGWRRVLRGYETR
jgi:hypothetical protein